MSQNSSFELRPERTAVVLLEFQKQWTGNTFYNLLVRRSLNSRDVVERTRETVRAARESGLTVIHAPLVLDPENKKGLWAKLTRARIFTADTWKAEFTPGVFEEQDIVVEGRYNFDGFGGSNLEDVLDENGIETVLFAGFITDQCVTITLETALDKGYDAYMLSDLTATWSSLIQRRYEQKYDDRCLSSRAITDINEPSGTADERPRSVKSE